MNFLKQAVNIFKKKSSKENFGTDDENEKGLETEVVLKKKFIEFVKFFNLKIFYLKKIYLHILK